MDAAVYNVERFAPGLALHFLLLRHAVGDGLKPQGSALDTAYVYHKAVTIIRATYAAKGYHFTSPRSTAYLGWPSEPKHENVESPSY